MKYDGAQSSLLGKMGTWALGHFDTWGTLISRLKHELFFQISINDNNIINNILKFAMLKCFYLRCMNNQFFFTDSKIITVISRSADILDNLLFLLLETNL